MRHLISHQAQCHCNRYILRQEETLPASRHLTISNLMISLFASDYSVILLIQPPLYCEYEMRAEIESDDSNQLHHPARNSFVDVKVNFTLPTNQIASIKNRSQGWFYSTSWCWSKVKTAGAIKNAHEIIATAVTTTTTTKPEMKWMNSLPKKKDLFKWCTFLCQMSLWPFLDTQSTTLMKFRKQRTRRARRRRFLKISISRKHTRVLTLQKALLISI